MNLEHATLLFLVAVFVVAEVFRANRGIRGVILSMNDVGSDLLTLPSTTATVKLQDGNEINAALDCCTVCIGQLKVGDEVRVTDSRSGYVIDLPWFRQNCKNKDA